MPAFHFRQRSGAMNWSKLAKVDVDEVVQEVDLAALQSILDDCTFSKVVPDGNIDNFVKLARLSQLLLEYMLHVQSYQDLRLLSASQELATQKKRIATVQKSLAASQKQNKALRREVLRYQTIMSTCQGLLRQYGIDASSLFLQLNTSVAGDGTQQPPPVPPPPPAAPVSATGAPDAAIAHTCAECGKVFATSEYLDKHMARRHPQEKAPEAPPPPAAPPAPVEPTPPEAEDSSIAEGAMRLAELVAKRKAELVSALPRAAAA
ncbi:C2H2 zinc finger protein [Tribonema minus]|uniref:C2H2 zinc finger protein n=1 Tax=Tribonema minus TaxID=303371 RepID=A0A836CKW3_9STRA|nr:C2H2 zinc finger protein [Tribonema minus]